MARPGTATASLSAVRRLVTLAALLAFFFQGLAIQTHIHPLQPVDHAGVQLTQVPAPSPLKSQDLDQSSCRLCQELTHSGAFVTPAASLLLAILTFVAMAFALSSAPAPRLRRAFAWQGRAPPRR